MKQLRIFNRTIALHNQLHFQESGDVIYIVLLYKAAIPVKPFLYASINLQERRAYRLICSKETEFNASGTIFSNALNE